MREDTLETTPISIHLPSARFHYPPGRSGPKRSPQPIRRRPHRTSRRTGHPREDLEQIAMVGNILAARRYAPDRGDFRPFARRYANGEVHHLLRDRGFLIKVPPSWRELHSSVRKLQAAGVVRESVAQPLGVDESRREEI